MTDLPVSHASDGSRGAFRIERDGRTLAEMTYTLAGVLIIIDHTHVDGELRGTGAGARLVESAVLWAREEGRRIMPLCPFAASVFDRTAVYDDVRAR